MPVSIKTQLNQPAELIVRPFGIGQEFFGVRAQRAKQLGNLPVMPADQNIGAGRMAMEFLGQFLKLVVIEPAVNLDPQRLGNRFEGEARTMTVWGIRGGKEVVQFKG